MFCTFCDNRYLSIDFTSSLKDEINNIDSKLAVVSIAELQADPVIAKRSITLESQMIMSNDSDLLVHNPKCILIHSFKTKKKDGSLYDIVLATSSTTQAEWIRKTLVQRFTELSELKVLIKNPPYVSFDKEIDVECRSLIACAMGNDYWIGGQSGFGSVKANTLLQSALHSFPTNVIERRKYILKKIVSIEKGKISCEKTILAFSHVLKSHR